MVPTPACNRLTDNAPEILRRWEAAVRASLPSARREGHIVLLDSLPRFIQEMAAALGAESPGDERSASRDHAQQRAHQTDYSLEQVVQEYGTLQDVVLDVLERTGGLNSSDLRIVLHTIQVGIADAVAQFARLQGAALLESEERNRSVLTTVVDGIVTMDESSIIQSINPAAERLFGYVQEQAVGRHVRMLMPEPYAGEHDQYVSNYLHTGVRRIIGSGREVVAKRSDGSTFPIELAISEFRTSKGRFFTGVVRDITVRKRLEDELRERAKELQAQNERKDEFLALLGHELRNPLAAIRSSAEVLRLRTGIDPAVDRAQGVISRQLAHLVRLVDDLLDIGRLSRGRLQLKLDRCDVRDIARQAVEATRPYFLERQQALQVQVDDAGMPVLADAVRISQSIGNLLHNASKFTRQGDRIALTVSRVDDIAEVTVEDNGAGIERDLLPVVFDTFGGSKSWRDNAQSGLGIGLKLVKTLVEMHGGTVHALSEGPGKGSRFVIRLPLRLDDALGAGATAAAEPVAARAAQRLLLVDDNVDAASSLAEVLRLQGHHVRVAHSAEHGLEMAATWRPDTVLLDIGLPGTDGYEVARRIRATQGLSGIKLIAVTGFGRPEDVAHAQDAGFDAHCTKPVDFLTLRRLI
jgi:PAS domain S-box-containing protein